MVWSQLALAAYACNVPRLPAAQPQQASFALTGPFMQRVDARLPNLCVAHCQLGRQIVSERPTPDVPQALLRVLYAISKPDDAGVRLRRLRATAQAWAAADRAPHAVLHCCLRD